MNNDSPQSESSELSQSTRFVILWHRLPVGSDRPDHYDVMVELPGGSAGDKGLATWAIESPLDLNCPATDSLETTTLRLPDHRLHFLDYEGPVSDDRGEVTRVLTGRANWIRYDSGPFEFSLHAADANWHVWISVPDARGLCTARFERMK